MKEGLTMKKTEIELKEDERRLEKDWKRLFDLNLKIKIKIS